MMLEKNEFEILEKFHLLYYEKINYSADLLPFFYFEPAESKFQIIMNEMIWQISK
jgi:hypothetical protein